VVEELGSRNGTVMRGVRLAGALPVGDGLELRLGGEVPIRVGPATEVAGAVAIEAGGVRYVAPLGTARVGGWRIESGDSGWLELVSDEAHPAYLGEVRMEGRATLLLGDAVAERRGEGVALRIVAMA